MEYTLYRRTIVTAGSVVRICISFERKQVGKASLGKKKNRKKEHGVCAFEPYRSREVCEKVCGKVLPKGMAASLTASGPKAVLGEAVAEPQG